jgi:hypothetical protein
MHDENVRVAGDWRASVRAELIDLITAVGGDAGGTLARVIAPYDEFLLHGQHACSHDLTDKALRSFRECVRLRPDAFLPHCALARIYLTQGNLIKAEKSARRAAELNPDDFKARLTLLFILSRRGINDQTAQRLRFSMREYALAGATRLGVDLGDESSLWDPGRKGQRWSGSSDATSKHVFRTNKYAVLKGLLPEPWIRLMLHEQHELLQCGAMKSQPSMNRYGMTDPPLASLVNYCLCDLVGEIVGRPVVPTYAFGIHYLPGGHIEPHTDRPQNELSMSLSLAVTPEGGVTRLFAGSEASDLTPVALEPNGALLYRGIEVVHAREPVPEGHTCDQMIFGFRTMHPKHCYCI